MGDQLLKSPVQRNFSVFLTAVLPILAPVAEDPLFRGVTKHFLKRVSRSTISKTGIGREVSMFSEVLETRE